MFSGDNNPNEWVLDILRMDRQEREFFVFIRHRSPNGDVAMPIAFTDELGESRGDAFPMEWNETQTVPRDRTETQDPSDQNRSPERGLTGPEEDIPVPRETLAIANDDIHTFLRSSGGNVLFDFLQNALSDSPQMSYIPISGLTEEERNNALVMREPCNTDEDQKFNVDLLMSLWRQFYFDVIPHLNLPDDYLMSLRLAALLALRNSIIGKFQDELLEMLEDQISSITQLLLIRQMIHSIQAASGPAPIPEGTFDNDEFTPLVFENQFPFMASRRFPQGAGEWDLEDYFYASSDEDSISLPVCTASSPGPGTLSSMLSISNESLSEELDDVNEANTENYNGDGVSVPDGDQDVNADEPQEI